MRRTTRRWLLSAVPAVLAVAPGSVRAQGEGPPLRAFHPGSHMVEVFGGYGRWLDEEASAGSYGFGAGYHYFLTSVTSVSFDVSADRLGRVLPAGGGEPFDFQVVSLTSQLALHAPTGAISPYVAVGAGPFLLHTMAGEARGITPRAGFLVRAGLRAVGWHPILGLDARYAVIRLDPENEIGVAGGEDDTRIFSVKASLAWAF